MYPVITEHFETSLFLLIKHIHAYYQRDALAHKRKSIRPEDTTHNIYNDLDKRITCFMFFFQTWAWVFNALLQLAITVFTPTISHFRPTRSKR